MLVNIFTDGQGTQAIPLPLHFEAPPAVGDMVEIAGQLHVVSQAWHQPDEAWAGAKFAILLRPEGQVRAA